MHDLSSRVVELVASGRASSRTEIARHLGAAPSTVSLVVGQLVARGVLAESGTGASTGGRPRKVLRVGGSDTTVLAASLGTRHLRLGVVRPGVTVDAVREVDFAIADGPEPALDRLAGLFARAADETGRDALRAVGLSMPGPVDVAAGAPLQPSRMPGWNGFPVRTWLEERLGVPVVVDNDANCMAEGELAAQPAERRHLVVVKAGTAIGAGIVIDGRPYRGATGAAGDIAHVRVDAAGYTPCSCGNTGCLETVASGAALARTLRDAGADVGSTRDVVRLAASGDPEVTRAVRRAGQHLGEVLAADVNVLNPDAVLLGGALATLEPFVAAVRGRLYENCHPLMTEHLAIERVALGADAALVGAGRIAMRRALDARPTSTNGARP